MKVKRKAESSMEILMEIMEIASELPLGYLTRLLTIAKDLDENHNLLQQRSLQCEEDQENEKGGKI